MMGDDEIGFFGHRFRHALRRDRQAGHHAFDFSLPVADQQADIIPLRRQPIRGEVFQKRRDGRNRCHGSKMHHAATICKQAIRPRIRGWTRILFIRGFRFAKNRQLALFSRSNADVFRQQNVVHRCRGCV